MRKFMPMRRSLADARIAYTLLIFISCALFAMGILASQSRRELIEASLVETRMELVECADSLRSIKYADERERLEAAMRFEVAAARLGLGDECAKSLAVFAERLKAGEYDERALKLADSLFELALRDLGSDPKAAIEAELSPILDIAEPVSSAPTLHRSLLPERMVLSCATLEARRFLGESASLPRPYIDGDHCRISTGNLKIDFSRINGSLERLVRIRLGADSSGRISEDELCERTCELIGTAERVSRLGSFIAIDGGDMRLIYDTSGRLWYVGKAL